MKTFNFLICASLVALSLIAGAADEPELISADAFYSMNDTLGPSRIQGLVTDAFMDDVDPNFMYLILSCEGRGVPVSVMFKESDLQRLLALIGRNVEVVGNVRSTSAIVSRAYLGRMLCVGNSDDVKPIGNATNPFEAPWLDLPECVSPEELTLLGNRRVAGRVLAAWGETELLLEAPETRPIRISVNAGSLLPEFGAEIEAVGTVETDTFNINLTHAVWKPISESKTLDRKATPVTLGQLIITNRNGTPCFPPQYNGAAVCLNGVVRSLSGIENGRFQIEDRGKFVTIDASSVPEALTGLERGCTVEITGTCVLDTEKWHPTDIFPRIRGLLVIPSLPEDVRITARAPWFTPARVWAVILALLGVLCIIFLWNRILWLRAYRRGKELSQEILARAEADMRTRERTRLAVELHDSIVQSLSAVLMELETAKRISPPSDDDARTEHVNRAERTLRSCHTDLRNCLWDLRSEALEEPDMSAAIRRTLLPHVKDVALDIRFNVARSMLTDNTAYMILRIIRELTLNGIKHGGAKHIRIAGKIEDGVLRISVRDDGSGYDPTTAPGILEGHFGLEGVRERLRNLSGSFEIAAQPQGGTRAVLVIPVPKGESTK